MTHNSNITLTVLNIDKTMACSLGGMENQCLGIVEIVEKNEAGGHRLLHRRGVCVLANQSLKALMGIKDKGKTEEMNSCQQLRYVLK